MQSENIRSGILFLLRLLARHYHSSVSSVILWSHLVRMGDMPRQGALPCLGWPEREHKKIVILSDVVCADEHRNRTPAGRGTDQGAAEPGWHRGFNGRLGTGVCSAHVHHGNSRQLATDPQLRHVLRGVPSFCSISNPPLVRPQRFATPCQQCHVLMS